MRAFVALHAVAVVWLAAPPALGPRTAPPPPPPPLAVEKVVAALEAPAAQLSRLRSLLIARDGELLFERYYRGARADRTTNIKSASKSVVSALVGIAIDRGVIDGPDSPIGPYFSELLTADEDALKRSITVGDLLSMRSGLETTSNRNYGLWAASRSWVRFALEQELVARPGGRMIYSTGNTHLLSAILTRASGESTWSFAQKHLAEPLGFDLARWQRDPEGVYFGGNNMAMTPRQMLAFGELYRNGGVYDGRRVLSAEWIEQSFVPRGRSQYSGQLYGYGWWIRRFAGVDAFFAWGYGGQYAFVLPELGLTVVATSSTEGGRERRAHRAALFEVLEQRLVEPLSVRRRAAFPPQQRLPRP